MLDLAFILLFCVAGVFVGVISGLLPGLHVNSISVILLSLSGSIVLFCAPLSTLGFSDQFLLILICCFILGVSVSHSFHDFIPTTFLGAPEEDTALSVLPAHSLLLQGRGYEAVAYSALGSLGAIAVCFLFLFALRFLIGEPLSLYVVLQDVMGWVLLSIVFLMIFTEKGKLQLGKISRKAASLLGMAFAAFVFCLSGLFGLIVFDVSVDSPIGLPATVLFPALSGLFGAPTLITSFFSKPVIPKQTVSPLMLSKREKKASSISVFTGSLAGILVSILPGITSATGTLLAMSARGESDNKQTIVTLSAVNTASAFVVIVVLFLILRARSGVAIVLTELIAIEQWSSVLMPSTLSYFLICLLVGGVLSYFLVLRIGKLFARYFARVPYTLLVGCTLVLIVVLVLLFTGLLGVFVFLVAACIGLLPVVWGVRRSHCMGVLLLPVILYFL